MIAMNQLFGERFKSARLLNGFSLQGLADALGNKVTKQALHKYEKGEVIPDSKKVSLLSDVLHVRLDYFFREMKVELGAIEYRKLKRMPAKEEHKVIEQTREYLSRYLELEEILGIAQEFTNPLKDFPAVSHHEQVEEAAMKLRQAWELGTG